ncbi:MAG: DUF3558 domain-containing protein [Pseudonocardiaceae bacterium]
MTEAGERTSGDVENSSGASGAAANRSLAELCVPIMKGRGSSSVSEVGLMRLVRLVAASVLGVVMLAGCTSTEAGQPRPASGGSAERLAPTVASPKDARDVPPCEVLTPEQITALGADPATERETSSSGLTTCSWIAEDFRIDVTLDATRPEAGGLNDTYLKRDEFVVFESLEVAGHPVVRAERIETDDCTLYVGLADTQAMLVSTRPDPGLTDPCNLSQETATKVISNLPPLS